jgi:hypothetical protein
VAALGQRAWAIARRQDLTALLPPALIALPALFWLWFAVRVAALSAYCRDQGHYQYIAWAMLKGEKLYRDIRDMSGPLGAYVHMVFQLLGGTDERPLRVLDLTVTSAVYLATGALLVGVTVRGPTGRSGGLVVRIGWALAAWTTLMSQFLVYNAWNITQRDSFATWFVLLAVALQLAGQALDGRGANAGRRAELTIAAAAALGITSCFAKPTFVLVSGLALAALMIDDEMRMPVRRRLRFFFFGAVAAGLVQLILLLFFGDVGGFLRTSLIEIPRIYVFLWHKLPDEIFRGWPAEQLRIAVAGSTLFVALIAAGELPRRALALGLGPVAAIAGVVAQAKGTTYHFHPVTALVGLQMVFLCLWLLERSGGASLRPAAAAGTQPGSSLARTAAITACLALGLHTADTAMSAPHYKNSYFVREFTSAASRHGDRFLALFNDGSFSRVDLEHGAKYLREHTPPGSRVLDYGLDPVLLFMAGRLSSIPFIYSLHLNPAGFLLGGIDFVPDQKKKAEILAWRDANARLLLEAVRAHPPAALVMMDGLYWGADGWADFKNNCPEAAALLVPRFKESARFGKVRVFLPR